MTVLLNNFIAQWEDIKNDAHLALEKVGASGWYVLGNEVKSFEKNLADYWGINQAVGCANGLDAIEIGLRVLGLRSGEYVITTPLSAFATTLAIVRAGGIPYFVDVDETGSINLNAVEKCLTANPEIRFLVPVHLYGHTLNLDQLEDLKTKFNLKIVEDCAQSIAAKYANRACGSIGQIAATSFYPTKNLGCMGDGGAVLTNDEELADAARCYRDYGQSKRYVHNVLGLNSRLDELQACILNMVFLKRLDEYANKRQQVASFYLNNITNKSLSVITPRNNSKSAWHLFALKVSAQEKFQKYLTENGVQSAIHYPVLIPDQSALKNTSFKIWENISVAQSFATQEVSLPINPYLTAAEIERVVQVCNSWAE